MVEEERDDRLDGSEPVGKQGHEGSDHRRAVDEQELTGRGWMPTAHNAKPKHRASHAIDAAATNTTAIRFRRLPRTSWASNHHAAPTARR